MKAFASLVDRLTYTASAAAKAALLTHYFRSTPDPDRGIALAILIDEISFKRPTRRLLSELVSTCLDPLDYQVCRDYVGDTAETLALLWPQPTAAAPSAEPTLATVCSRLAVVDPGELAALVTELLDGLDVTGRWVLFKLLAGELGIGVTARLAKAAAAALAATPVDAAAVEAVDAVLPGLRPPYRELFAWLEQRGPPPPSYDAAQFKSLMTAQPLSIAELDGLDLADFLVEWKWDGLRVELATAGGRQRLYSSDGGDISGGFPDLLGGWPDGVVADGVLLIVAGGEVRAYGQLLSRLNRKAPSTALLAKYPAHLRLHDLLVVDGEDLRQLPLDQRRQRLETWHQLIAPPNSSLSEAVAVDDRRQLAAICIGSRRIGIDGLMLKRTASRYVAGHPHGQWYKLKRPPLKANCVVLYAERGSGKKASFHSHLTLGAWRVEDGRRELVPVGKAACDLDDIEMTRLEQYVRDNTRERFGPVRSVVAGLVVEIAFGDVQRSSRHKSGLSLRSPRVSRILWDMSSVEADDLQSLEQHFPCVA